MHRNICIYTYKRTCTHFLNTLRTGRHHPIKALTHSLNQTHTDRLTHTHTERQTYTHAHTQTDTHTQTDRLTRTHTHRQTYTNSWASAHLWLHLYRKELTGNTHIH